LPLNKEQHWKAVGLPRVRCRASVEESAGIVLGSPHAICADFGAGALRRCGASHPAGNGEAQDSCKTPENAASCYWTHGRLSIYNGNPPWRMWKVGTHRILAICSGPSTFPPRNDQDSFNPELPPNLERAYKAEEPRKSRLKEPFPDPAFADFEVCPLEGEMQAVCIESAKRIFVDK
jgi:hypothetical protein